MRPASLVPCVSVRSIGRDRRGLSLRLPVSRRRLPALTMTLYTGRSNCRRGKGRSNLSGCRKRRRKRFLTYGRRRGTGHCIDWAVVAGEGKKKPRGEAGREDTGTALVYG